MSICLKVSKDLYCSTMVAVQGSSRLFEASTCINTRDTVIYVQQYVNANSMWLTMLMPDTPTVGAH